MCDSKKEQFALEVYVKASAVEPPLRAQPSAVYSRAVLG